MGITPKTRVYVIYLLCPLESDLESFLHPLFYSWKGQLLASCILFAVMSWSESSYCLDVWSARWNIKEGTRGLLCHANISIMLVVGTNGLPLIRQDIYHSITNSISAFDAYFTICWKICFYFVYWGCCFRLALYVIQKYLPTNQNKNKGPGNV